MWYFTTTTYRAALPYDHVDTVFESMQNGRFRIDLDVIVLDNSHLTQINDLNKKLVEILNQKTDGQFVFNSQVRKSNQREIDAVSKSSSIQGLKFEYLNFFFFFICKTHFFYSTELNSNLENGASISPIRIYVFDEKNGAKFSLLDANDYYFLDSLYLTQTGFVDVKNVAKLIELDYLDLQKVTRNYEVMLNNERDFVS